MFVDTFPLLNCFILILGEDTSSARDQSTSTRERVREAREHHEKITWLLRMGRTYGWEEKQICNEVQGIILK